jgi:uncharacterized membrane protein YbhN (UPF0104 family)
MSTGADDEWPRATDQHSPRQTWGRSRTLIAYLVKVGFSGALFWIIFSRIDIGDVIARMRQLSFGAVLLVAFAMGLHVLLSAIRWRTIIAQLDGPSSPP